MFPGSPRYLQLSGRNLASAPSDFARTAAGSRCRAVLMRLNQLANLAITERDPLALVPQLFHSDGLLPEPVQKKNLANALHHLPPNSDLMVLTRCWLNVSRGFDSRCFSMPASW